MTGYTVDVDALNELRSKMQAYLAHCETSLSRVESLIGQVSQSWDGAAAEAYEARHRDWVRSAHDMRTALADFTAWSTQAEDAYRTVMAMNLRMAGQ
ncbi:MULTISPECIES: WXG100 family type VII secretion target [Mycobacteriaceae]|uniref:ESAT-6-like protein n=1 Tax=Mycolicibacterium mucogenicum TaxID=56689 RepID=A0A1A0MJ16_MYCMU|nr:WXG100 family type VII secretion target [Mycolicibacterium mucogenicum]OBA85410.1 hypothetical protein A5642_02355 [Mycolicibacterium mucogenicum]